MASIKYLSNFYKGVENTLMLLYVVNMVDFRIENVLNFIINEVYNKKSVKVKL